MCSIWRNTVMVNKQRTFIRKQCVFCLLKTSESVKHKFFGVASRWVMFIMHDHSGVWTVDT